MKLRSRKIGLIVTGVIAISALLSTLIVPSKAHATTLPVIHVSGTISSDQTWTDGSVYLIDGTVTIASGTTVTINAGTIVKSRWDAQGISVGTGASLTVAGGATNPVIFTSYADDSVGGDSNGDGSTATSDNDYDGAIQPAGGNVHVQHTVFRNGNHSINAWCVGGDAPLLVTDSTVHSTMNFNNCDSGVVQLQRNSFDVTNSAQAYALYLYNTVPNNVSMSGLNTNNFVNKGIYTGSSSPFSSLIPVGTTWEVSGVAGAVLSASAFTVGGTLKLEDGLIVKAPDLYTGLYIKSGGTLNVDGSDATVVFTSSRDDSVGGDTNRDGPSTGQRTDYTTAINVDGGTINISHARFSYGSTGIGANCNWLPSVVNVSDSQISNGVSLDRCDDNGVSFKRNQFSLPADRVNYAVTTTYTMPLGLILSGADKNTFTGSGMGKIIDIGYGNPGVLAGKTWTLDGSTGAVIRIDSMIIAGTMNLNAGAIVKSGGNGFSIEGQGQVNVNGTVANPVTYTSLKDDSVGGDSTGDGTTAPSKLDYASAFTLSGAASLVAKNLTIKYSTFPIVSNYTNQVDLTDTNISHASIGLQVRSETKLNAINLHVSDADYGLTAESAAKVMIRGTFENVTKDIQSCNWGQSCSVDAAYTDWGSNGPYPTGGDLVCGNVTVSPWKVGTSTQSDAIFRTKNCDGSPTPDQLYADAMHQYTQQIHSTQISCDQGFQDACDAIQRMFACVGAAVGLATANSPFPLPGSSASQQADTYRGDIISGAQTYVGTVTEPTPAMNTFKVLERVTSVVGIWAGLANAYTACH